jgi:hypothetical protein
MLLKLSRSTVLVSLATLALGAQAQSTPAPAEMPKAPSAQAPAMPPGGSTPTAQGAATAGNPVKMAFQRTDANTDGRLSREEATSLPAVAENFNRLDKDSDGFISAAEFEAGVAVGAPAPQ